MVETVDQQVALEHPAVVVPTTPLLVARVSRATVLRVVQEVSVVVAAVAVLAKLATPTARALVATEFKAPFQVALLSMEVVGQVLSRVQRQLVVMVAGHHALGHWIPLQMPDRPTQGVVVLALTAPAVAPVEQVAQALSLFAISVRMPLRRDRQLPQALAPLGRVPPLGTPFTPLRTLDPSAWLSLMLLQFSAV